MRVNFLFQRGSSMSELLVLSIVMVPLFFYFANLAKVSDANQSAVQASRYAAWERSISNGSQKSDNQLSSELDERFFTSQSALIYTNEKLQGIDRDRALMFNGLDDQGKRLAMVSNDGSSVSLRTKNDDVPSDFGVNVFVDALSVLGDAMDGLIDKADWDLEQKGLYTANVDVKVQGNKSMLKTEDSVLSSKCNSIQYDTETFSCISQSNVIFTDTWTGESPSNVDETVRSLVPSGNKLFTQMGKAITTVGYVPFFKELRRFEDAFGDVQEDVLPADRYGDK